MNKSYSFSDGMSVIADIDSAGSATWYTRGINLLWDSNGCTYLFNAHGDVVALVSGGAATATFDYDAFGIVSGNAFVANPFRYCGEYWDAETGLIIVRIVTTDAFAAFEDEVRTHLNPWDATPKSGNIFFVNDRHASSGGRAGRGAYGGVWGD